MKITGADLLTMRLSMLAICASVLLSIAILYGSNRYANRIQIDHRNAQSLMDEAQNHLIAARQDQQNMSAYSDEYGALEDHKIIGDEQRLDWMEGLERLRSQNLVGDFRYHIAPQKNHAVPSALESGNFGIHYSEMQLQFDLLHEAQLLNFFDALRSQINGRYQLEGCTLQRDTTDASKVPHLKAECNGGWITLKNRNTPP